MNPREIWQFEDGSMRLVVSPATYNASALNRAITVAVRPDPPTGFHPFAVATPHGTVLADAVMQHPRHWLTKPVARLDDQSYRLVREHLTFLLGG